MKEFGCMDNYSHFITFKLTTYLNIRIDIDMIQIDDKLISEDIFSEEFVCNLSKCKGICCVEGDAGAPA